MVTKRSSSFRIAVVGAGRMGRAHLDAIENSDSATVGAVVDPDPEARDLAAARGITAYPSVEALLSDAEAEGVVIAAPTDLHERLVGACAAAGLAILCEKPCGLTSAEAAAAVALAQRHGVVLQVAYWRRFVSDLEEVRERIGGGELGEVLSVQCEQWDAAPPAAAFLDRSGGIFVDMGVHEFDQIRWLTSCELETVKAVASRSEATEGLPHDVDCGQVVGSLSDGGTALVSLGRWHASGDSCRVEVFGTKRTVRSWFLPPSSGDGVLARALVRQIDDFVRLANGSSSVGASGHDAVVALALAEAATNDARVSHRDARPGTPLATIRAPGERRATSGGGLMA
jgi:myo-inositol 2-dehydrogenase / D-chiro-inositol 1-dehydrogenase